MCDSAGLYFVKLIKYLFFFTFQSTTAYLREFLLECRCVTSQLNRYNQGPDFDDMSSFLCYVTDNVPVHINSIHDPLDTEIYILLVTFGLFCHFGILGHFWMFCVIVLPILTKNILHYRSFAEEERSLELTFVPAYSSGGNPAFPEISVV
jgi:hypothetical protein